MKLITGRKFLCCVGLAAGAQMVCTPASNAAVRSRLCAISAACFAATMQRNQTTLERYQYTQLHMGTQVRVTLYAPDSDTAEKGAASAFRRYAEIEDIMSDYRPTSELMRLCAKAGGPAVPVSRELIFVLANSLDVSRRSGGAFDVTASPLIRLWRTARKTGKLPADEDIWAAKALVGWQNIRLDKSRSTVQLLRPGMQLDLGGIAKGYANDEAMKRLMEQGIRSAMLEAGGDILVSGAPPGKAGWLVLIGNPGRGEKAKTLSVSNCAVASSGDTEQFVEIGGKRYSHVVDPKTGLGLTSRIAATVTSPAGILGDALSTTMTIVGKQKGEKLARQYKGVDVYIRQVE